MALPAINRLPLRTERDRLTREGKSFHTRHLTVVSAQSSSVIPAYPRFSILLSKKTAKLAVDRNRIKRLVSAAIIELLPTFPSADYLIIPKRSVLETPYSDLLVDLKSLLPKLK